MIYSTPSADTMASRTSTVLKGKKKKKDISCQILAYSTSINLFSTSDTIHKRISGRVMSLLPHRVAQVLV